MQLAPFPRRRLTGEELHYYEASVKSPSFRKLDLSRNAPGISDRYTRALKTTNTGRVQNLRMPLDANAVGRNNN